MCLDVKFSKEKTEKILKKLPEEITVYKVMGKDKTKQRYRAVICDFLYEEGENKMEIGAYPAEIDSGFYAFKTRISAWFYLDKDCCQKIVKCKIYKKDIRFIGKQEGGLAFVSSKITVPKYKD